MCLDLTETKRARLWYSRRDMENTVTLTDLLPIVHKLPAQDKLTLIRILAEDLDVKANIFPFQPNRIYYLPTPYNSFGAGKALMSAMNQADNPKN